MFWTSYHREGKKINRDIYNPDMWIGSNTHQFIKIMCWCTADPYKSGILSDSTATYNSHSHILNKSSLSKDYMKNQLTCPTETALLKPLTAGAIYIRILHFLLAHTYQLLNLLKLKSYINQQDLKFVDLHFVKS